MGSAFSSRHLDPLNLYWPPAHVYSYNLVHKGLRMDNIWSLLQQGIITQINIDQRKVGNLQIITSSFTYPF